MSSQHSQRSCGGSPIGMLALILGAVVLTVPISSAATGQAGAQPAAEATSTQHDQLQLVVKVDGALSDTGQAIVSLFDSAESYLKQPLYSAIQTIDQDGHAEFSLSDLAAGRYAVSVIYDQDSNGELNTGLFGIPSELVGFSNNVRGRFGPPKFRHASFELVTSTVIEIHLAKAKN